MFVLSTGAGESSPVATGAEAVATVGSTVGGGVASGGDDGAGVVACAGVAMAPTGAVEGCAAVVGLASGAAAVGSIVGGGVAARGGGDGDGVPRTGAGVPRTGAGVAAAGGAEGCNNVGVVVEGAGVVGAGGAIVASSAGAGVSPASTVAAEVVVVRPGGSVLKVGDGVSFGADTVGGRALGRPNNGLAIALAGAGVGKFDSVALLGADGPRTSAPASPAMPAEKSILSPSRPLSRERC